MSRKFSKMQRLPSILTYAFISLILLCICSVISAQSGDTTVIIRTIDMRGQDPLMASAKSIVESRKHVVVVLVKGASEELINETKDNLKALVLRGYDRIGMILCGFRPDETLPVIGIVSDGTMYATIKGAKPDARTMLDMYSFVEGAYQANILPLLGNSERQKN